MYTRYCAITKYTKKKYLYKNYFPQKFFIFV